jgi:DDE family transposase
MSHQDQDGRVRYNAAFLQMALQWLIGKSLAGISFREDCTWLPVQLASAALLWVWSDELTLGERFVAARKITALLYQPQREFGESYQCFLKLLRRWTSTLVAHLRDSLRHRMREALATLWEVHGFALFGVDGSRIELPRTKSHEAAYSVVRASRVRKRNRRQKPRTAAHVRKANLPLMWLTVLWHAGTGLPWAWRIGPTDSSEREHWREMIPELPDNALVAADAGYVGYEYARALLDSGRHLLLRVGSNVRLLRKLGWTKESKDTVYLWPYYAQPGEPPIVLRLVVGHNGKHPIYLVTSVLSSRRLTDHQILDLYRRRWGIELFFRHLKQTYQRRKLRSENAENARVELEWSLIGLWGMALYAQAEIYKRHGDPTRISIACVLRSYRRIMRDYRHPVERGSTLSSLLRCALRDPYTRTNKASRNYPCKKQHDPPPRAPAIRKASLSEVRNARTLRTARLKKG